MASSLASLRSSATFCGVGGSVGVLLARVSPWDVEGVEGSVGALKKGLSENRFPESLAL
jgi:hypothetical protein